MDMIGKTVKSALFLAAMIMLLSPDLAHAQSKVGILPPDLDYQKICIKRDRLVEDNFNWNGRTPASSGLSDEHLVKLARLYLNGSAKTVPNYGRVKEIVAYLKTRGGEVREDALQIEYLMIWNGKGEKRSLSAAKRVLEQMVTNGQAEAYGYFGDIYEEEGNYQRAAENYKRAYALGRNEAAVALAYLYGEGKIPGSESDINNAIIIAQDMLMSYILNGRCNALTTMGLMYDRLKFIPKSEYLSAKWFEKAAALDEISPKIYLAEIIQRGFVIDYDEKRILRLWREAAALGSGRAMFLLGEHGLLNHKNTKELKQAVAWLQQAGWRGHVKAMENLAKIYGGQYPELKDEKQQLYWLKQASQKASAKEDTLLTLASLYEKDPSVSPETIFNLYKQAAAKGEAEAYLKIGDSYRFGFGVESSPVRALRYYRLAANGGEVAAMRALKEAYECQMGVPHNEAMVSFWAEQMGYYGSGPTLDKAYNFLITAQANIDAPSAEFSAQQKKIESSLYRFAVAREDAEAMVFLSLYFEKTGDSKKAKEWMEKALATDEKEGKGYPAHALLGDLHMEGVLVENDVKRGIKFLKTAADHGNAGAQKTIGKWYIETGKAEEGDKYLESAAQNGKATAYTTLAERSIDKNNPQQAIIYLEKAARLYEVQAMIKLAKGYEADGWIGSPDEKKSREWFDKVLNSYPCDYDDFITIAQVYLHGKFGVQKDEDEARKWLDRLSDAIPEDEESKLDIAKAILSSGLSKDEKKRKFSLKILEGMGEEGNTEAVELLAETYLNRDFPDYNTDKGVMWLTRGADSGDVSSMMSLANMYVSGYGVDPSIEKAEMWLNKAKEAGSQEAAERLNTLTSGQ